MFNNKYFSTFPRDCLFKQSVEILFNSPDNYLTLISNQVEAGISLLANNGAVHIEVTIDNR